MKKAEYPGDGGYPQRDSAEHEEYAGARSTDRQETEETDSADLLERILSRENLNRAYKRVKGRQRRPSNLICRRYCCLGADATGSGTPA